MFAASHPRVLIVLLASLLALPGSSQSNAFLPTAGEATVTNAQGRSFKGELRGYTGGQVVLMSREGDAGEVTRRFNRADVQAIVFPGYELTATAADHVANERWQAARDALETLARQRGPYLEVLSASDLGLFFALVEVRMRTGAEIDGIALARRLERLETAADRRGELADAILLGHWQLGLVDEARTFAREWCARAKPDGPSALGWRILGEIELRASRNDDALWIAMQPVAYSSFENPPHLDACYAIATTAAHRLGDDALAARLRAGMDERGLAWPAGFAEPDLSASARAGSLPAPGSSKKPDLHLRLDQVRKLIVNIPES
ncbi:MAG TPA: hypothetical protein VMM36_03220 [Opitutaceae bacterium]|nr:hypothetical protein [Opitutaceae bacterium]